MHYKKSQIADTSFKIHEHLKIFEQPDSQLFITHNGNFHKINQRTFIQEHRFKELERSHS